MSVNSNGYIHLGGNIRNIYILLLLSLSFGTVTDIDGNTYETVQIGDQLWMAENLKVTQYSDGSEIPTGFSNFEWAHREGAYAVYDDIESIADTYGYLYNWFVVDDSRGVCPDGWHIPSDDEIIQLEMYLGMSLSEAKVAGWRGVNEGSKLADRADLWNNGDLENNPEFGTSGFTALPAGYRSRFDGYYGMGVDGYFWSSTESSTSNAWVRNLFYSNSGIYRDNYIKEYGFYIRCLETIEGCTHPNATNYDDTANVDDGSCEYETVQIGHQVWMQENLKATHYRNGDAIATGLDNDAWVSNEEGAYAVYDNDPANAEIYGNLYNWYAVGDNRGVCPESFHVPSDDEFKQLEIYLGMNQNQANSEGYRGIDEGGKLKEAGLANWNSPNTGGNNESGFTALPSGSRWYNSGEFTNINNYGHFWSSTDYVSNGSFNRELFYEDARVIRWNADRHFGFSVRCLSDETQTTTILVPENFATIQEAIDYSIDGDTVLVSAGTYLENINFNGKSIALIGEDRETTIIDGGQNGSVITINEIQNSLIIKDFTLINGSGHYQDLDCCSPANRGGGVEIMLSNNILLENMNITENNAINNGYGGGVYVSNSSVSIINSSITNNFANKLGGGLCIESFAYLILNNTTFSGNNDNFGANSISLHHFSNIDIVNSIIYDENAQIKYSSNCADCQVTVSYSNLLPDIANGGEILWNLGNIETDPLFTDPDNGDFTLQSSSPCIDAGDPASELDPDGTVADMGAYYFHQIPGCTHPNATNYDETANVDDGSCEYETVQIGHQVWMSENLKATHYRNGDAIPTGLEGTDWSTTNEGAYGIYDDDPTNADVYGNLYNWYAVDDDRGICPEGYHIPTDANWLELEMFLGMSQEVAELMYTSRGTNEGSKLAADASKWNDGLLESNEAFGSSGFMALPGGYKEQNQGDYIEIGEFGFYWSTDLPSNSNSHPIYRSIYYDEAKVGRTNTAPITGFSIRCLSNDTQTTTILVPENFATIQEAIDYSIDSDTVLVSAGTYLENINFNGKNIALIGEDRETTIIDGGQNGSVVTFENVESGLLDGFTIQNGLNQQWGGGIYCHSSNLDIINCQISNNTSSYNGGGIHINDESTVTIANSIISNNEVLSSSDGGGIAASGDVILNNVNIINNTASNGAGVNVSTKTFTMNGGSISGNTSYSPNQEGGALQIQDAISVSLDGVEFANNNYDDGTGQGSAIGIRRTDTDITNCIIRNNTSGKGAVYIHDADVSISNTLFLENVASNPSNNYGAIFVFSDGSSPYSNYNLNNVTFVNNEKSAIHHEGSGSTGIINNSIFWNPNAQEQISFQSTGSYPVMTYSTIYPMSAGNEQYLNYCLVDGWCDNVIFEYPQFNGDYTLQPSSPCIDAGDPEIFDPDGSRSDMGAYYFPQESNTLSIDEGANLMSFSVLPRNGLDDLPNDISGIIGAGVAATNLPPWSGSLQELSCNDGYWLINSGSAFEWDYFGIPCSDSLIYNLNEGANLISYSNDESGSLSDVLPDDVEDCLSGIIGQGVASNNMPPWMGSLTTLEPNKGYWFKSNCEIDFQYEEPTTLARLETPKTSLYPYNQSAQQAFYFIESIENIEQGDIIHTYSNGINVGSRVWNGSFTDVPAMGDDGSKFTAGYCKSGSIPTFKVEKANGSLITLTGDIPEWSNNQLYMIGYLEESIALPAVYSLSTAYPNPFNPTTTLSFAIPIDSEVSLSVYNLQGREVSTLIDGNMDAGYHSIVWDANSYASGVYFVKMVAGDFVNTQKLMLVK